MPFGAIAGAVIGGASSLLSDSGDKSQTRSTQVKLPPWLEDASFDAVDFGQRQLEQEYDPAKAFQGLRQNDLQESGFLGAQGFRGSYQPQLQQAGQYLGRADQTFPDTNLSGYINPYMESAIDPAAREMGDAFERQRNQRNATSAQRGAFGGLRNEIGNDFAEQRYLESVGDLYDRGLSSAFDRGTSLWQADRANQFNLSGGYQRLADLGGGLRGQEVQAQLGAGGIERGIRGDLYREERDFAENEQLQPLLAALSSVPYGKESNAQTTSTNDRSTAGAIGQGLAGAIGGGLVGSDLFGGGGGGGGGGGSTNYGGYGSVGSNLDLAGPYRP